MNKVTFVADDSFLQFKFQNGIPTLVVLIVRLRLLQIHLGCQPIYLNVSIYSSDKCFHVNVAFQLDLNACV